MGLLSRERSAFRYDAHGNPIEKSTAQEDRVIEADEQGELHVTKEGSHTQHTRFQYQYDKQGNWTERVLWGRLEPNPNFERRNVERREITYHVRAA
jgi:YD repeat-containing protein